MKKEDIIALAKEVGFKTDTHAVEVNGCNIYKALSRFAELVLATHDKDAVLAEREACAKICDDLENFCYTDENHTLRVHKPFHCAMAIRNQVNE